MRITRFLRNPRVSVAEMISHAAERTAGRAAERHILTIQDTTSLRDDGQGRSINLHPTIAVDAATGALLGLVHAEVLRRDGGAGSHKERGFEDKESRRWLRASEQAARLLETGAACVTEIADREADIYEQFALKPDGVDLLIRAPQDRRLADGRKLFDAAAAAPELGEKLVAPDLHARHCAPPGRGAHACPRTPEGPP